MSNGQKSDFQDGGRSPSRISKISSFGHVTVSGSLSDAVYQISLKSEDFSLRYGDKTIFKMAAVRHLVF